MQTKEYSKSTFDIQYPLLVAADSDFNSARYYANPLWIRGKKYHMCNDWYERMYNDDRSYLLSWIDKRRLEYHQLSLEIDPLLERTPNR